LYFEIKYILIHPNIPHVLYNQRHIIPHTRILEKFSPKLKSLREATIVIICSGSR